MKLAGTEGLIEARDELFNGPGSSIGLMPAPLGVQNPEAKGAAGAHRSRL